MALVRASATLRSLHTFPRTKALPAAVVPTGSRRSLSGTPGRRGGGTPKETSHHNEPPYDGPNGWLWGIPPGEKPEREGWEWPMAIGGIAFAICIIVMAFKPDTSLNTWALEEARRRLEKEGILVDPFPDHVLEKKE